MPANVCSRVRRLSRALRIAGSKGRYGHRDSDLLSKDPQWNLASTDWNHPLPQHSLLDTHRFGYRDYPEKCNPTYSLKSARILKKDRTKIDPFTIQDAETLIAAIHRHWGEAQGNYDEFRFWNASLRADRAPGYGFRCCSGGALKVTKARVGIDKPSTSAL